MNVRSSYWFNRKVLNYFEEYGKVVLMMHVPYPHLKVLLMTHHHISLFLPFWDNYNKRKKVPQEILQQTNKHLGLTLTVQSSNVDTSRFTGNK